jgi:acetyltransferase-like isoleucine patch superfamily enzyme
MSRRRRPRPHTTSLIARPWSADEVCSSTVKNARQDGISCSEPWKVALRDSFFHHAPTGTRYEMQRSRLKTLLFDVLMFVTNHVIAHLPSRRIRLAFYRRALDFEIGSGTSVFMGAQFDSRHGFRIGKNSVINENCRMDNRGQLTIGDCVSISAETVILTADHDVQSSDFAGRERPVEIGDYAFLGTRCTILPGVRIGRGAVVGAGSLVTRDVPDYTIVAGNPAKTIGQRNQSLNYQARYERWLH